MKVYKWIQVNSLAYWNSVHMFTTILSDATNELIEYFDTQTPFCMHEMNVTVYILILI